MMNHHRKKQKQKQRMKFYLSHEQEQDEGKPCDTNVSPPQPQSSYHKLITS